MAPWGYTCFTAPEVFFQFKKVQLTVSVCSCSLIIRKSMGLFFVVFVWLFKADSVSVCSLNSHTFFSESFKIGQLYHCVWGLPCHSPLLHFLFKIFKLIPGSSDEMKAFSSNILDANPIKFQALHQAMLNTGNKAEIKTINHSQVSLAIHTDTLCVVSSHSY